MAQHKRRKKNCASEQGTNNATSYDPTAYVQRARVTKAAPPKPAANPLQFVQIKPCNLYQSAQEQLKRAEEVKKVKEVVKEEPEDWQSNLENWKSCRRKRVEHIIDRVVEAKKLEMESIDRNRKKSKTFSEMMEERGSKGRKCSLPVYNDDDDANDYNGFGFSANDTVSGKSSICEDYENQSVNSDNPSESDKNRYIDNNSNHDENYSRESISSPGFDDNTSNSTLSAASPDPAYGSSYNSNRSPRIQTTTLTSNFSRVQSVESWAERHHSPSAVTTPAIKPKPRLTPKIEGHLAKLSSDVNGDQDERNANIEIPKVDISSRRELFEKEQKAQFNRPIEVKKPIVLSDGTEKTASIKERLSHLEKRDGDDAVIAKEVTATNNKSNRVSGDFSSARDRFVNSEQFVNVEVKAPKINVPVVPLKERLLTLESSKASETSPNNTQLDNRTKKMNEPKMIDLNEFDERMKLNAADNDVQEENLVIMSHKHQQQNNDNDSGINSDDLQSSLASQQSQTHPMNDDEPPMNGCVSPTKQHGGGRKPEVLPRRQITPDLVKTITPKVNNIEDDLLQSQDEIDDEADNSVIDALDIALNAIDTEKPNDLIDIATSFDEIYEEINEFKPLKATTTAPKVKQADAEKSTKTKAIESKNVVKTVQPVKTANETAKANTENNSSDDKVTDEPYYQVPKSAEPYYEVPSSRPIPVYENVDMYYDNTSSAQKFGVASSTKLPLPIGSKLMEPPKEKPPPPPAESNEEESDGNVEEEPLPSDPMKRINSTKRIKKEIRSKRSSFLGIEGSVDDDSYLELNVAPPPDMMSAFIQEERRIEKQMYIKSGLYDSSDTAESRDSGVSENHSRQSSEPITSSSEEQEQEMSQSRPEIISALEKDKKLLEAGKNALAMECRAFGTQQWVYSDGFPQNLDNDPILKAIDEKERARCIEEQIREEEEVLRVERELLQLEQEELKRQRENIINRKAYNHLMEQQQQPPPVDHRRSLQNINVNNNLYANVYSESPANNYHIPNDHRKSMPNLQEMTLHEIDMPDKQLPPIPPAKPLRVQEYLKYSKQIYSNGCMIVDPRTNQSMPMHLNTIHQQSNDDFLPYVVNGSGSSNNSVASSQQYSNMSRHTLHELSAAPKPKFQDAWVQQRQNNYENTTENGWHSSNDYIDPAGEPTYIQPRPLKEPIGDTWLSMQQKRRSDPNFNYNKHWLIQEAEQRRIDQARNCRSSSSGNTNGGLDWPRKGSSDNKPLPEAVIQTLAQRVQRLSDKKRLEAPHNHYHHHHPHQTFDGSTEQLVAPQHQHNTTNNGFRQQNHQMMPNEAPKEILSVSGKKKCSYCCEELGRGAAMIIESLRLFYHLDCFKCCVCRVQLGDGVTGADVRVRNQKLHCNNCFSSDDGVKFSCV